MRGGWNPQSLLSIPRDSSPDCCRAGEKRRYAWGRGNWNPEAVWWFPGRLWAWSLWGLRKKRNKRKRVRHLIGALGNHTCPFPVRVLSSVRNPYKYFCIPSSTQLQTAGEQSVSFHLLHPLCVCLHQGIAHDKLTSCLWRDWSTPMLGEPSQPVGTRHTSTETRNPPVGNT